MNIYVVIENQFPDNQFIMICRCNDSDQAVTAYYRLWEPVESSISACILIGTCNETEPAVLWKNFLTEENKPIAYDSTEEENTDETTTTSEGESTD